MASMFTCVVNLAGPGSDGTETTPPVVYFELTDTANPPAFTTTWFFAADNAKNQMLAVALAAVSTGSTVYLEADPPKPQNDPLTQIYRMYINRA
jgi:hypothetical protein